MYKNIDQFLSQSGPKLCNEYCKAQEEKMKETLTQYLTKTGIYAAFKPRPHCSTTAIGYISNDDAFQELLEIYTVETHKSLQENFQKTVTI